MSALTDTTGFVLNELVAAQRGLSEAEAIRFMETGELPDLASAPVLAEDTDSELDPNRQVISISDAETWLAGRIPDSVTAATRLHISHITHHSDVSYDEMMHNG